MTLPACRILLRTLPTILCCTCLILLAGCGKKGFPEPNDTSRSFTWKEIYATPAAACLAFVGTLEGEHQNLDRLRLEIASNGPDDCVGCPFVPKEIRYFSRVEAGYNQESGGIAFSYCPPAGKSWRWRLAALNKYNRLPYAVSAEQMTE